jgi:hypothetical protein
MNELRNRPRESRGMEREGPCLPSSAVSARCPQKRQRVAPCGSVPATPNTLAVKRGDRLERRRVGDAPGLALEDHVHPRQAP